MPTVVITKETCTLSRTISAPLIPMGAEAFYNKWSETYDTFSDLILCFDIDEYLDDPVERSIDS